MTIHAHKETHLLLIFWWVIDDESRNNIRGPIIKFANLKLEGLFIMNLYQLDKQSTKFTVWKY